MYTPSYIYQAYQLSLYFSAKLNFLFMAVCEFIQILTYKKSTITLIYMQLAQQEASILYSLKYYSMHPYAFLAVSIACMHFSTYIFVSNILNRSWIRFMSGWGLRNQLEIFPQDSSSWVLIINSTL